MPPQNRVGRDDRGDLTQPSTSQPVRRSAEWWDITRVTGHYAVFWSRSPVRFAGIRKSRLQRILTARAAKSASTVSEMIAWSIIRILPHRAKTGVSVGEKAVLVLNARNK
jgi:hypothetical protein